MRFEGLFCPFRGLRSYAEFVYADRSMKSGSRRPLAREGCYTSRRYSTAPRVKTLSLASNDYLIMELEERPRDAAAHEGRTLISYPHLPRWKDGLRGAMAECTASCFVREPGTPLFRLSPAGQAQRDNPLIIEDMHLSSRIWIGPAIIAASPEEPEELGEPGIEMALGSPLCSGVSTLENFVAFVHYHTEEFGLFALSAAAMPAAVARGAVAGRESSEHGTSAPQPRRIQN